MGVVLVSSVRLVAPRGHAQVFAFGALPSGRRVLAPTPHIEIIAKRFFLRGALVQALKLARDTRRVLYNT